MEKNVHLSSHADRNREMIFNFRPAQIAIWKWFSNTVPQDFALCKKKVVFCKKRRVFRKFFRGVVLKFTHSVPSQIEFGKSVLEWVPRQIGVGKSVPDWVLQKDASGEYRSRPEPKPGPNRHPPTHPAEGHRPHMPSSGSNGDLLHEPSSFG